jgi:hypothetical protein
LPGNSGKPTGQVILQAGQHAQAEFENDEYKELNR